MPRFIAAVLFLIGIALPASAQSRDRGPDQVPPSHRPPPGMCRIWIDGLPPGQQPEPTDCATAVRERPAGSRVIFGDRRAGGDDDRVRREKRDKSKDDSYEDGRRKKAKNFKGDSDDDRGARRGDDRCANAQIDDDECNDITLRQPGTWPRMVAAVALSRGSRTDDVRRWLGDRATSVRYDDRDRNGRPERATWYDRSGQLVQEWVDSDRDGVADRIRLYRDGKLMRVYEK
jgi:hypothetical protein